MICVVCVCVFFCFGGVPRSYLHPSPMQLHCSNYYDNFFPLWTNGVPTMSILPTTNIILFFIFFPMASRRVHVVSKHAKEVNQNHFPSPPPKYISRVPTLVVGKLKVSTFNKGRYSIGRHTILGRG